jgi:hypothetical protein
MKTGQRAAPPTVAPAIPAFRIGLLIWPMSPALPCDNAPPSTDTTDTSTTPAAMPSRLRLSRAFPLWAGAPGPDELVSIMLLAIGRRLVGSPFPQLAPRVIFLPTWRSAVRKFGVPSSQGKRGRP